MGLFWSPLLLVRDVGKLKKESCPYRYTLFFTRTARLTGYYAEGWTHRTQETQQTLETRRTQETHETLDSGDTADTGDTKDSAETGDTQDTQDSADTGGTQDSGYTIDFVLYRLCMSDL